MKHKSVEMSKKMGHYRVNEYYRLRNLQSYKDYVHKIDSED